MRSLALPGWAALAPALALAAALSIIGATPWRRAFIALGFPLSLAATGFSVHASPWLWLLPLAVLALIYPLNPWRDAPMFPTPRGALEGLSQLVRLPATPRVLDAGCGLGDGLIELRRAYPAAQLEGLEWSWPLLLACGWRCRFARIVRADIWAADWSGFDMVYLFQRPESMPRAAAKAGRELRSGAWLASLEFPAQGLAPTQVLECPDGRSLWLYRAPFRAA